MIEEEVYKGYPMLVLRRDEFDQYPFKMGVAKAKLVITYFKEIQAFVNKYENKPPKKEEMMFESD